MKFEEKLSRSFLILGILTLLLVVSIACNGQYRYRKLDRTPFKEPFNFMQPEYQVNSKALHLIGFYTSLFILTEISCKTKCPQLYSGCKYTFIGSLGISMLYISVDFNLNDLFQYKPYKVKNRHRKYYYN